MATSSKKQLVIIGAGPAGFTAAFLAADQGLSVTLINQDPFLGGACLHRGCIPSKALLSIVQTIDKAKKIKESGVHFQAPQIHLDEMNTFKKNVISRLSTGLMQLCKQKKILFIQGVARFTSSATLTVEKPDGSTENFAFAKCIIATGSTPAPLPFAVAPSFRVMSSNEALDLSEIPATLLVVGGGYIGMEIASIYAGLGSQVTICEITDNLLAGIDQDLIAILMRTFKKKMASIKLATAVQSIRATEASVEVTFAPNAAESQQSFHRVLIATGRKPNTDFLGIKNTKIQLTEKGFIKTLRGQQTHDKNIYAIGDVTQGPMLAHKAAYEASLVAEALAGKAIAQAKTHIPAVVFTDPEIAYCGLTEKEAQQKNIKIKIIKFSWAANGRAISINRADGLTKLILDAKGKKLLGVGIVGPEAGELIAQAVLALEANVPLSKIAASIFPHPTLSETFKEALEISLGRSFYSIKGEPAAR